MSVFKGSTEVATVKMVILKGSTAVGGGKMVVLKASTAVDGKIWAIFLFPPRFFAKNDRGGHFHRGGRQNMRIFPISTAVDDRKWPF